MAGIELTAVSHTIVPEHRVACLSKEQTFFAIQLFCWAV